MAAKITASAGVSIVVDAVPEKRSARSDDGPAPQNGDVASLRRILAEQHFVRLISVAKRLAIVGNSTGDRDMFEWTIGGGGLRLRMLVSHEDVDRERAHVRLAACPIPSLERLPIADRGIVTKRLGFGQYERRLETRRCVREVSHLRAVLRRREREGIDRPVRESLQVFRTRRFGVRNRRGASDSHIPMGTPFGGG